MVEEYSKSCRTEGVVEGAGAKVARTLSILRHERQHTMATELLLSDRESRLQMDKQA